MASIDNDRLIEYERMSLEDGTTEDSVGVSKSKILVELENDTLWQPSDKPRDCDFYLYRRAFPGT